MSGFRGNRYAMKVPISLCLSFFVQHAVAQFVEISPIPCPFNPLGFPRASAVDFGHQSLDFGPTS